MEKKKISIRHQLEKSKQSFMVLNPDLLKHEEVKRIFYTMGVDKLPVKGGYTLEIKLKGIDFNSLN